MALINCPECNEEISDKAGQCPHCGYPLDVKNKENGSKKMSQKQVILVVVGIICCIIALKLITDDKFKYAVENYSYFVEQYEKNCAMADSYGNRGILGRGYQSVASEWKDLKNVATRWIVMYGGGALIFGVAGFVLIIKGKHK